MRPVTRHHQEAPQRHDGAPRVGTFADQLKICANLRNLWTKTSLARAPRRNVAASLRITIRRHPASPARISSRNNPLGFSCPFVPLVANLRCLACSMILRHRKAPSYLVVQNPPLRLSRAVILHPLHCFVFQSPRHHRHHRHHPKCPNKIQTFPFQALLKTDTIRPGEGAAPMPITPKIFPQSRTITHPHPSPAIRNSHEHLGPTMIAFREITTFFSKTMIAFREKPHFSPPPHAPNPAKNPPQTRSPPPKPQ